MSDEPNEDTQKTQPKKGEPIDIPIPSLGRIARDFEKIALADHDEDDETADDEDD